MIKFSVTFFTFDLTSKVENFTEMTKDQANIDNRANQLNPNHGEYKGSGQGKTQEQANRDNHANQLNPNNSKGKN